MRRQEPAVRSSLFIPSALNVVNLYVILLSFSERGFSLLDILRLEILRQRSRTTGIVNEWQTTSDRSPLAPALPTRFKRKKPCPNHQPPEQLWREANPRHKTLVKPDEASYRKRKSLKSVREYPTNGRRTAFQEKPAVPKPSRSLKSNHCCQHQVVRKGPGASRLGKVE